MRAVFLAGRGDPAEKGQAIPRDSKLHRDRLVSRLAAKGPGIRVGDVLGGNRKNILYKLCFYRLRSYRNRFMYIFNETD